MFSKRKLLPMLGVLAVMAVCGVSLAQAQVTLPSTGVDVADHIDATITAVGAIVLAALGGFAAFLVIRFGMRWLRRSAS